MGMLKHPESPATKKTKKLLGRGPKVVFENQVSRDDVISSTDKPADTPAHVTFPVNLRVNNHLRNQVAALQNLGLGATAKDVVESLLDTRIEMLDPDDLKRFNQMLNVMEQMDADKHAKK